MYEYTAMIHDRVEGQSPVFGNDSSLAWSSWDTKQDGQPLLGAPPADALTLISVPVTRYPLPIIRYPLSAPIIR